MQCPRCARSLPEGTRFCFSCGSPVSLTSHGKARVDVGPEDVSNAGTRVVQVAPDSVWRVGESTQASFTFQEFNNAVPQSIPSPGDASPGIIGNYPGTMPYPVQAQRPLLYTPGVPLNASVPTIAAAKPRRRGRSAGCIVLYAFIAITLLFTGLGVGLYEIGSHVLGNAAANYAATKTVAMHLYQQVTAQPPSIQDPLTGASSNLWSNYERATYGCTLTNDGLHAHISDKGYVNYCMENANLFTNVAFQVQMQILTGDGGGLIFRALPNKDDNLYRFQVDSNGTYILSCDKGASSSRATTLASGSTRALDTQTDTTNTVAIIAQGSLIDLFINQQFVAEVHDSSLTAGGIGVLADDHTNPADVLYTNAQIWDLDNLNV